MKNKILTLKQILLIMLGVGLVGAGLAGFPFVNIGIACLFWAEIVGLRKDNRNNNNK
tara:strand:+ start:1731 stop:1901 length:171 start_codon:yes stop_codon:yes gene_type:complete